MRNKFNRDLHYPKSVIATKSFKNLLSVQMMSVAVDSQKSFATHRIHSLT